LLERADKLKKILIIYANSGAGHRRAAEALFAVAKKNFSSVEVKLLDVLDYTTSTFKRSYPATYLFMVNHCPKLWGFCFYLLDNRQVDKIARVFRRKTNSVHGQTFMKFLLAEDPDLILTTHFLPNELISCLKKRHQFQTPLITCITDYYPHAWWRDSGVDLYIVPNQDLVPRLLRLGIGETSIATLGIPIHPNFAVNIEQAIIREKLGLSKDQFTVLITSGGFGVGPIRKLVAHLNRIATPLQLVVI
jgi:processive 1,2-diacylglycerol beta-glucosyltransferase